MKKNIIISVSICIAVLLGSCVTKQKYNELQNQYKKCQADLTFANSENVDYSNAKKQLTAQVEALTKESEQLKKDTLSLSRRLRQS